MTQLSILNQKWLSEIEILDFEIESANLSKLNYLEEFCSDFSSHSECVNMTAKILKDLSKELESVVPWFLSQMPLLYLYTSNKQKKQDDIIELVSAKVLSEKQITERFDSLSQSVTLIAAGDPTISIAHILPELSRYPKAKMSRLFTSVDKKIALCELYQAPYNAQHSYINNNTNFDKKYKNILQALFKFPKEKVEEFLLALDKDYLELASIRQVQIAFEAINYCMENENAYIHTTNIYDSQSKDNLVRIDVGLKNFPVNAAINNMIDILNRYNIQVHRLLINEIQWNDQQKYSVANIVAVHCSNDLMDENSTPWRRALRSIKALSYIDHGDEFSNLLQNTGISFSLNETNFIRAMVNWVHIFLTKKNPYYYSLDRVSKIIVNQQIYIEQCVKFFRTRFEPHFDGNREMISSEIKVELEKIILELIDEVEKEILKEGVNFVFNILKTNYFLLSKAGLCFKMNPAALNKELYPDIPYGIFYMIGRNFRAFQVRYREIARGGLRVILPRSAAEYDNALAGLFDEVNGLAYAQQLKNKDIPEGGSKCVMVVKPKGNKTDAVKAVVSSLLDIILVHEKTGKLTEGIIDYYGKEEIIYLGPDENLTDDLIMWITQHALHRNYKYAYALMSSKADFGINHKTYAVTSEGLNIYLNNVLHYLNLENSTFRVKMTGGPDGDVAGNEMNILYREYGERCRLVAVADGCGAAYDPSGLDWQEILRLFKENKSILEFNVNKLTNKTAFVIAANTKENLKIRDNLYASVEAEIFIPAGGRPYTIKETNWDKYLLANGRPSSLAIIEGANIFLTKEARQKLVDKGTIIIKDSSANKAGVSCSSYEIIACLTIKPEEFADIKTIYVKQVLNIIRKNADEEAKLLFREWLKNKKSTDLVKLSFEISAEINQAKDILLEKLSEFNNDILSSDRYTYIILNHCPKILAEKYKDRILEKLPRAHKIAILSAHMASHLIYREGLNWLETMQADQIFKVALDYMDAERHIEKIIQNLKKSEVEFKLEIEEILRSAGAKYLASRI